MQDLQNIPSNNLHFAQSSFLPCSYLHLIHSFLLILIIGVIKLADFGLAKTLEYGASLAESFCGTLDFIAPERMAGKSLLDAVQDAVIALLFCILCVHVCVGGNRLRITFQTFLSLRRGCGPDVT